MFADCMPALDRYCAKCRLHTCQLQGITPQVHVYDSKSLQRITSLQPQFELGVSCLALSADGQWLAVWGAEPHIQLIIYAWRTVSDLNMRAGLTRLWQGSSCSTHLNSQSYIRS